MTSATVQEDDMTFGHVAGSSHAPAILVTHPNGGEYLSGEYVVLSWNASDLDGDDIFFDAMYSSDNGSTWDTLVVNYTHLSLNITTSTLRGTSHGLLRVFASDAFYTTSDTSDSKIYVSNNKPIAKIVFPVNNSVYYFGDEVDLDVRVFDQEDGSTVESSLRWASDIEGYLTNRTRAKLEVSSMTPGRHVLSVETTDSSGETNDPTVVSIEVFTSMPSSIPSSYPTWGPTISPTYPPSTYLLANPTTLPTAFPTCIPTTFSTDAPSVLPSTVCPTVSPTVCATCVPSTCPSHIPSCTPSCAPVAPTATPSHLRTNPTSGSTYKPTRHPLLLPTMSPTESPSELATTVPT
mmetsp:Transcript_1501/g.2399  ORF Transcript_1501/g.2399 Transcript_1501/m.2399 type:complete len:349 (+) Transcript_1501:1904-2950(+)